MKINIEDFPVVKLFLEGFKPKIRQTGEALTSLEIQSVINHGKKYGIEINANSLKKSRKKTNNKWFETQDSIDYWEDFFSPKIIFQEMVQEPNFIFDEKGKYMCLDTARIIVGKELRQLLFVLNSKLFFYAVKTFYGGGSLGQKGIRMKHTFFTKFPMRKFAQKDIAKLEEYLLRPLQNSGCIDTLLYTMFDLNQNEIEFIESLPN